MEVELYTIEDLEKIMKMVIEDKKPLGLFIEMPGFEEPELIINPYENLKMKLDYYKKTYDENLNHKHAKGIKIVAYSLY